MEGGLIEAGEPSGAQVHESTAAQRAQRRRIGWVAPMAGSYALDTVFLGLFAASGTIGGNVAAVYGCLAALVCAASWKAYASGWNLRLGNPDMVEPLIIAGVAMQLGVVAAAPQIAFPYLANLFTVTAFGMISMTVRASLRVWILEALATGLVLYAVAGRAGLPSATPSEMLLTWLYFSLILARCLLLSANANQLRSRLSDSRVRLEASLEQVRELATHDELTRTFNRRALLARLAQEQGRAVRAGEPFSVAMFDLDRFKAVNDTHGHAAGDAVLQAFSETVHDTMRTTDVFGRYGGEEFLLILVGTAATPALEAVERVRAAVAARDWPAVVPGLALTVSAGLATFRKGETIEQLINRADAALYDAKRNGRNRIEVSPP